MKNPKCEVVKFSASDGYIYTGLLYRSGDSQKTIIHIHGMCGNMLSFSSLLDLADAYIQNGYNLLTFDLKAHDCIAEGNWTGGASPNDGYFFYVGGSLEIFERCIVDIESAINFVSQFSAEIILQGHSMGCERIITFQLATKKHYNTILISPCDAYKLQMNYIYPQTIDEQIEELKLYDDSTLLPPRFFGINSGINDTYTIPIYKKALLSILTGMALKVFRQDENLEYYLPISCICLLGENDPMQTYQPHKAFDILKNKFQKFNGFALQGNHEMIPVENDMVALILKWLKGTDRKSKPTTELSIEGKWISTFAEDGQILNEKVEITQTGKKIEAILDLNKKGKNYKYNFTGEYENKILTGSYSSNNKHKEERGTIIVQNITDDLLFGYIAGVPLYDKYDIQQSPYILTRVNQNEVRVGTLKFCSTCIRKFDCCCSCDEVAPPIILPFEAENIRKKLKIKIEQFVNKIEKENFRTIFQMKTQKDNKSCYFFKNGRCSIYECKPIDCRMFPYDIKPTNEDSYSLICYTTICQVLQNMSIDDLRINSYNVKPLIYLLTPYIKEFSNQKYAKRLNTQHYQEIEIIVP